MWKGGDFDYNQNLKAAAIGGLAGAGNAAVATAVGVTPVTGLNLLTNLKNREGLDIFVKTAILKQAAQDALNSSEQRYNAPETSYKSSKKP